jgi:hypothetical protein
MLKMHTCFCLDHLLFPFRSCIEGPKILIGGLHCGIFSESTCYKVFKKELHVGKAEIIWTDVDIGKTGKTNGRHMMGGKQSWYMLFEFQ